MERPARPFTRREVLALIASALAGTVAYGGSALALAADAGTAAADTGAAAPTTAATFSAFCDTLIPADALSPSASALGVPARILAEAGANAQLQRLVGFSCAWLDQAAGGDFARADEGLRDGILEAMSALPWEAPQRRFFDLMRNLAMGYFYSSPAALAGMATDRPPQPAGHFASLE